MHRPALFLNSGTSARQQVLSLRSIHVNTAGPPAPDPTYPLPCTLPRNGVLLLSEFRSIGTYFLTAWKAYREEIFPEGTPHK